MTIIDDLMNDGLPYLHERLSQARNSIRNRCCNIGGHAYPSMYSTQLRVEKTMQHHYDLDLALEAYVYEQAKGL